MRSSALIFLILIACDQNKNPTTGATTGGTSGGTSGGKTATSSGGTSSGTSSGGEALTPQTFMAQLTTAVCTDKAPTCCQNAGFPSFDTADCAANLTADFTVTGTGSTFSPTAAQACLDAIAALPTSCIVGTSLATACSTSNFYVGSVALGGACTADSDCAAQSGALELYCQNDGAGTTGFCSEAALADSVGAPCNQSTTVAAPAAGICSAEFFCNDDNQCAALLGASATCVPYAGQCQSGLYCDLTSTTCLAVLGNGAACAQEDACQDGDSCDDTMHCAQQLAPGAICDANASWSQCAGEANCDALTGHCLGDDSFASDDNCGPSSGR